MINSTRLILLVLLIDASVALSIKQNDDYKIVCYYTNWAQYRNGPAKFFPKDIDPHLCTHIIYSFAKIDKNYELSSFEWNDESTDFSQGMYHKTVSLKAMNKDLKVLIAVGGWTHGSLLFSDMAKSKSSRNNFIEKSIVWLKKHRFDGLDLDWEYPANRDTEDRPEDRINFSLLCQELYEAFKAHGLILTAAVAAGEKTMKTAYEMHEIHKYLDFINIMAYDLHGSWDKFTGHNAPLVAHKYDQEPTLTVDHATQLWLDNVPSNKLILGIGAYGRSFELDDGFESCPHTNTPISAPGSEGDFSREKGILTYFEVCKNIIESKWQYIWNDRQKVPYAHSNLESIDSGKKIEWIGFDDVKSTELKVKYAIKNKLGGAMLWTLDYDDFNGEFCNQGKYPILSTINYYMNKNFNSLLPQYEITNTIKSNETRLNFNPKLESDLISTPSKKVSTLTSSTLSSTNAFSLINNDELQIYKFCQCKNGTHHLKIKFDENFFFAVDCNEKKVFHSSNLPKENEVRASSETSGKSIADESSEDYEDTEKPSGFFLFNFTSSASVKYASKLQIGILSLLSLINLFI